MKRRNATNRFGVFLLGLIILCGSLPVLGEAETANVVEQQWSLRPLQKASLPVVGDLSWPRTPVDRFILSKIERAGLKPTLPADRRTLIRRVTYDLTGLPPTMEEVESFVANKDSSAYRKLVDRLLASPRYGEHWARHWLDLANYADTHGNDHDYARTNAWPYRDYVIRAFNDDKPYKRFVQEQVAGDALFPDDPQATVALGFLAAGPWDHTLMVTVREDTVDHHMAQVLDRDNMVTAVMSTFQSLTVHCARCHNHKFDPISQREYYALQAVFAGVDRADRPFDPDVSTHARRQALLVRKKAIATRAPALLATLNTPAVTREVADFEEAAARREKAWTPFDVVSVISTGGATLARQPDGSWFASGTRPPRDTYIVTARWKTGVVRALRLEALPDERLPHKGPGRFDNGHFHLTEFRAFAGIPGSAESAKPIVFGRATADQNEGPTMSAAQAIDDNNETHWGIHPFYGVPHQAVFELKVPTGFPEGTMFTILLEHQGSAAGHGLGRFRLSASAEQGAEGSLAPMPAELASLLKIPTAERTEAQRRDLALSVLAIDSERALAALPSAHYVYGVASDFPTDGNFSAPLRPRPVHLLARGDVNKPRDLIAPGALSCVPGLSSVLPIADDDDESARRAALALWLTDDHNVLTWRSIVNRVWGYHFGRGLCDTPNDFGKMGSMPSHPALLDWLAVWFRDEAHGSIKELDKLILLSATYQEASVSPERAALNSVDPENRLLARMNSPRLTAEEIRDAVLQFSGRLDLTMGGPAAIQFVQHGDATFMPGGNPAFLDYEHFDPDAPENRRRAVYRFLFRTVADPFMDALDCPDGGSITPVRSVSTTALQAFAMLNDAFLIRQCEHIAQRLCAQAKTPESQAELIFQTILERVPLSKERSEFAAYIQHHGLANACQLLLNSNEFLYLD
jgi:hypothetical protein